MDPAARVIGFIDMDCFYVAVERVKNPRLRDVPCAVVQYDTAERNAPDLLADMDRIRKGHQSMGGIIAVSYEARARGVTRQMSGKEALKVCPEITLVQVPTAFGKADLRIYKKGGDDVVALLSKRADATEKRSVDEVAIDITSESQRVLALRDWHMDLLPSARQISHLADSALSRKAAAVSRESTRKGHEGQQKIEAADGRQTMDCGWQWLEQQTRDPGDSCHVERLLVAGAIVVAELRAEVKAKLGFTCSGGVATNKILAKLGCGLHKPDQQTILLPHSVQMLMQDLPLDRLTGLGGQFGESIKSTLGVSTVGDLLTRPRAEVMAAFPERGCWLLDFAAGKDSAVDAVKDRQLTKSLVNGKTFFHNRRLVSVEQVEHWLQEFAGELHIRYREQVELHQRAPTTICVSIGMGGGNSSHDPQGNYWDHQANYWESAQAHTKQQSINLGREGTVAKIAAGAKDCFRKWHSALQGKPLAITSLGLSLTGMEPIGGKVPITAYFKKAARAEPVVTHGAAHSCSALGDAAISKQMQSERHDFQADAVTAEAVEVVDDTPPSPSVTAVPLHFMSAAGGPEVASAWRGDIVDESVLAELPWDIQKEIRSRHPQYRSNSALGSSCSDDLRNISHVAQDVSGGDNIAGSEGRAQVAKRRRMREDMARTIAEITID